MDREALEYTRDHYNRHANQYVDTKQALHARATGASAPLKKFHNTIKRKLIERWDPLKTYYPPFLCMITFSLITRQPPLKT